MTASEFHPEASGDARQVNIAGDNHGPVHIAAAEQSVVHIVGDPQLHVGARGPVSINVSAGSKQTPSFHQLLALGSVEAPFGRLPESVLGRDDVFAAIASSRDCPRIQVLSGMGGIGKTTVALRSAEQAKRAGAEVYWISAGSASTVSDGMRQVALLAGAPADYVAHAWEVAERPAADLVWRYLTSLERPWLLVFDDADDLDVLACSGTAVADATGWVRPPVGSSLGVLVTTRDGNERSWGDRISRFRRLEVLERRFAGRVLRELAPTGAGGVLSAEALGDRLGCLPLALHLAGTYLAVAHADPLADAHTFEEYLVLLDASPLSLDSVLEGISGDLRPQEDRVRRTIAGTWGLSIALLERHGMPHARDVLQLLSCFAPTTPLPRALVDPSSIASLEMWTSGLSTQAVRTTIRGLHRFGLIAVDSSAAEPVHEIHRLVAEVSVAPLLEAPVEHRKIWNSAADLLVSATPYEENPRDPSTWLAWQGLAPHWLIMLSRSPEWETGIESRGSGILICGGAAVSYLNFRGDYRAACELADSALNRSESADVDQSIEANLRRHRAIAVMGMGDLKAAEAEFDSIMEKCILQLGSAHPMTVSVRYDRASVIAARGKEKYAEQEYDEVIRHETELYGADAAVTLLTRHSRAICIRSAGRLREAAEEGARVLAGLRVKLGKAHPNVLEAQHEYAVSLRDQGDNEDAAEVFDQVLKLEEETLGAEHPSTLITRANLALTLMLCGELSAGEAEIRAVIDARTRILGPNHHQTLDVRGALAIILVQKGELDAKGAEAAFTELIVGYREQLIDEHPLVLAGREGRAAALRLLGERINAESEHRAILDAATSRHGAGHLDTLNAHFQWAAALGDLGRPGQAVTEMRNVLSQEEAILGSSHGNVAITRRALGVLLLQHGLLAEAEETLQHIADVRPEQYDIQQDLAAVLLARGRLREAIDQLRAIAEERQQRSGPTHLDTLTVRNNLGIALKEFGELDEAVAVYRGALKDAAYSHSDDQPITLTLRHGLAVVLRTQGNLDEAQQEFLKIESYSKASS